MNQTDIEIRATEEAERLRGLLFSCGQNKERVEALEPIISNTAWMKAKLDDARDAIKSSNVAIPYDNGGGQKGIRENPLFKGYESLWKSYLAGMAKILEALPSSVVEEEKEQQSQSVLQLVRSKHRA